MLNIWHVLYVDSTQHVYKNHSLTVKTLADLSQILTDYSHDCYLYKVFMFTDRIMTHLLSGGKNLKLLTYANTAACLWLVKYTLHRALKCLFSGTE